MSSIDSQRTALLALLGRKLAGEYAIKTVLFHQAIADRLGLNTSDLMCLSILSDAAEPLTAGQLAEATGLTAGSVTVMIDRLEKAGYVQRDKDATDRRRVIVRPLDERIERDIAPLYAALGEAWVASIERYSTPELAVILDMLTRSVVLLQEQIAALRRDGTPSAAPPETQRAAGSSAFAATAARAPRATEARLLFANGANNVSVHGAGMPELYVARFEAPEPQVHVQGEQVQLRYPRFSFFQRGHGSGTLALTNAQTWRIESRGGISTCTFDLRDLTLGGLSVTGGAFKLELELGPPHGVVPITIVGGAADITMRRPAGTATELVVRGGATRVRLDERYAEVMSAEARWETPNAAAAAARYEITVDGGASNLSVVHEQQDATAR